MFKVLLERDLNVALHVGLVRMQALNLVRHQLVERVRIHYHAVVRLLLIVVVAHQRYEMVADHGYQLSARRRNGLLFFCVLLATLVLTFTRHKYIRLEGLFVDLNLEVFVLAQAHVLVFLAVHHNLEREVSLTPILQDAIHVGARAYSSP